MKRKMYSDTDRLNFLIERGWTVVGRMITCKDTVTIWAVCDKHENIMAQAKDPRAALDAAMRSLKI